MNIYEGQVAKKHVVILYSLVMILGIVCLFLGYRLVRAEEELARTRESLAIVKSDLNALSRRVYVAESGIKGLNNSLNKVCLQLNLLEGSVGRISSRVADLAGSVERLDRSVGTISSELGGVKCELESLKADLDSLQSYLDQVKLDLAEASSWLQRVSNELETIANILYGRAYATPAILMREPSEVIMDFVDSNVKYSNPTGDLRSLSHAVYHSVRYAHDPSKSPILSLGDRRGLSSLGVTLPECELVMIDTVDVAKTPTETLRLGKGDCDDYAMLYVASAHYYLQKTKYKYAVVQVAYLGSILYSTGNCMVMPFPWV